jgi:hypothetical protein
LFYDAVRYRDGSFSSLQAANRLVNSTLSRNSVIVAHVASGAMAEAFVTATFSSQTGVEAYRPSAYSEPYIRDTFGVGVYIVHDQGIERGFRVISAYPRND